MKREEVDCLIINKLQEGMDYPEINEEIQTLKESQIVFKKQKDELSQLNKKIQQLTKENENLRKQNFKLKFEKDSKVIEKREEKRSELKESGEGTIRDLKRLLLILRDTKEPLCLSQIKKDCLLSDKKALSCLGFLEKYNLVISEENEKGITKWIIR
jgi:TolA-binding protein